MTAAQPQTWVFLRGLMRDSRHWGAFPDTFRQRFPNARIELIDFPGNGLLNREASPLTVEAMADHARAELSRRGLKPPYCLLAMSLGAMAATAWADRHPIEIAACVLINTSLRPFSPPHWRLRPDTWPVVLKMLMKPPVPREVERTILRLTSRTAPESLLDDWTAWRLSHPVSRANVLRQLAAAARYRAPLAAPAVPLLIVNGGGDRLVDPRCSQRLAALWHCALAVHPRAGHDLPLDDGEWLAATVHDWRVPLAP